jgi:hypothetical protein
MLSGKSTVGKAALYVWEIVHTSDRKTEFQGSGVRAKSSKVSVAQDGDLGAQGTRHLEITPQLSLAIAPHPNPALLAQILLVPCWTVGTSCGIFLSSLLSTGPSGLILLAEKLRSREERGCTKVPKLQAEGAV